MKILHAICEQTNLDVDAYELQAGTDDTPEVLQAEEQRLLACGAEYLVVKTPVNRPDWLFTLPEMGYTFVETVFHVTIRRNEYHMPAAIARFDRGLTVLERTKTAEQISVYTRIRNGVFKSDRISIDPAFSLAQSANRYVNWIKQMLEDGGRLYEVVQGARPVGFFIIHRVDAVTVDPVLMGLYDEEHNRGMGALLHKKTLDTCFAHDCKRLTSTIVSNNAKVLRIYVNAGATIADTLYTYVKHVNVKELSL